VLIGPVLYFILDFVWRFVTDPIAHACWAGLTGYFIGLAATGRYRWYQVGWIGLCLAAVLHGLNDWSRVNGHPVWILVVLVSGILFLGYAQVGSRGELHISEGGPLVASTGALTAGTSGEDQPPEIAARPGPGEQPRSRRGRPWWEH
jgi:hypothetical protein